MLRSAVLAATVRSPAHFGVAPQVCAYLNNDREHDGNRELRGCHANQGRPKSGNTSPELAFKLLTDI